MRHSQLLEIVYLLVYLCAVRLRKLPSRYKTTMRPNLLYAWTNQFQFFWLTCIFIKTSCTSRYKPYYFDMYFPLHNLICEPSAVTIAVQTYNPKPSFEVLTFSAWLILRVGVIWLFLCLRLNLSLLLLWNLDFY